MTKQLLGNELEASENLDGLQRKQMDLQYLDQWENPIQRWLVTKGIELDSGEDLEVIGFKVKGSALTMYNHFRRDKGKTATFFTFILVLQDILIELTTKDLLL